MALRHYFQEKNIPTVWSGSNVNKNMVIVQLWGAGGGGGTPGGWSFGAEGGGGGYVYAEIPIAQLIGRDLILVVGEGGLVNGSRVSYGGGGQANRTGSDNRYGSNGGGYTGLFLNNVSQANAIAIAGGGGGGGSSRAGSGNVGGAGGGTTGQNGVSAYDGKTSYRGLGGTQSAGGAQVSSDASNTNAPAGALIGGTAIVNGYGGAGGGGYWGGSAGGYSEPNTMGGGGGGSGYLNPFYTINGRNIQGNLKTPAGITESGFRGTSIAYGGDVSSAGKNGFARITINGVTREYSYTGSDITIPIFNSISLVTSGLILNLDAGNISSYPGSGTTWFDLSGGGNNGTLVGGVGYSSNGGGSLIFDGSNDYVNAPLTKTSNCTFSCWAKTTTVSGSPMLFNAGPDGSGPDLFFYNNKISWNTWDGDTNSFGTLPASVTDGNWHNYVVVNDSTSTTKLYYDGSLLGSAVYKSAANNTNLTIGGNTNSYQWNGSISNFLVYNRVLLASEITQNFNALRSRFGV